MNASSSTATTTPTTIHLVLVTVTPPVGFCVDVTTERHCRPVRVKRFGKPNSLPGTGGGDDPFFTKTLLIGTFNCASKKTSGGESDPQNPRANQNRP
jgi:hypothetical protein